MAICQLLQTVSHKKKMGDRRKVILKRGVCRSGCSIHFCRAVYMFRFWVLRLEVVFYYSGFNDADCALCSSLRAVCVCHCHKCESAFLFLASLHVSFSSW